MTAAARVAGSFRDPSGFVFSRQGIIHRQIGASYAPQYERLMSSGLYARLVQAGQLLPHDELDIRLAYSDDDRNAAYKVIRPAQLQFVSHPFEWSFSQLKDAALTTLQIQQEALKHGMTLKDASAYNIQLHSARPVLIDTLSFDNYEPGSPWVAYRQFCQHFLAPLALMSRCDLRLSQFFRTYIDGVPLDLASKLLPFGSRFSLGLGLHIHAHARMQQRHASDAAGDDNATTQASTAKPSSSRGGMSLKALQSLVTHLEQTVASLSAPSQKTEWDDYYAANNNYGSTGLSAKEQLVQSFLGDQQGRKVWDLGANNGRFSRLALACGASTVVAWDIDPNCVDANYRQAIARHERGLFPLQLDLTNPSPAMGWANRERASLADRGPADVVLALGLIHHLAISNNVPLPQVAEYLHSITRRLIIEWVPKEDSQVRKLLTTRPDIFPGYTQSQFETDFAPYFKILKQSPVEATCRTMYLMEGK